MNTAARNISSALLAASAALVANSAYAADDCRAAEILSPGRGAIVSEGRPEIRWKALPGAARYRVQLESRVPEGAVIARVDTRVSGERFVPHVPLTDERAAVKLLVTADCAGASEPSVIEEAAHFFVEVTGSCPAPADIALDGAAKITWTSVASAQSYELAIYSAVDGRTLAQGRTIEPSYRLPALGEPSYLALRTRCAAAYSSPAYRVIDSPKAR
jgi:hypothetical protein